MSIHFDKKRKSWYVKFKNKTYRSFSTKQKASAFERDLQIKNYDNEKYISINDVIDYYLNYSLSNLEYGSYMKSKDIYDRIIIPYFKNKNINEITEIDCVNFANYIKRLDYSTSYKNYIVSRFKQLFNLSERMFGLQKNPSKIITKFKKTHKELVKQRQKEQNVWNVDEFSKFIVCVDGEVYKEMFIVLYLTGMRLGECLALQWNDLNNHYLSVTKSITRKTKEGSYLVKEPKTQSSVRKVYLNDSLYSLLLDFKSREMRDAQYKDSWFIFYRDKPLSQTTIDRKKENAINKSGVKRIRIHDFRHSHASNLIADGIDIVAVSKRMGHSNINITLTTYAHLLDKSTEKLIESIENSSKNLLHTFSKQSKS